MSDAALRMLKARDVSQALNIDIQSVYTLIREGEIPAARFGRRVRIDPRDLDRYIAGAKSRDAR